MMIEFKGSHLERDVIRRTGSKGTGNAVPYQL